MLYVLCFVFYYCLCCGMFCCSMFCVYISSVLQHLSVCYLFEFISSVVQHVSVFHVNCFTTVTLLNMLFFSVFCFFFVNVSIFQCFNGYILCLYNAFIETTFTVLCFVFFVCILAGFIVLCPLLLYCLCYSRYQCCLFKFSPLYMMDLVFCVLCFTTV